MPRFGTRSLKFFVISYDSIKVFQLHPKKTSAAALTQMNQNRKQKRKTRNCDVKAFEYFASQLLQ